jgi:tetratricopeptide (TPR) repeat protein
MAEDLDIELPQAEPAIPADLAMAAALDEARAGPELQPDVKAFFRAQTDLAHQQRHHMDALFRLDRWSRRLKLLLQIMVIAVGLSTATALAVMAWSASREQGVVVEAFSVPPDLAARGLTGQVVAAKFLDDLQKMQDQTRSSRAPNTYANNWSGEVKVEIPETGVSIGELHRFLVDWLGRNTKIEGDVYRTPQGFAVTARAGALPAADQAGAETDLDALIQAAAEDVYAKTQPYRYGVYLTDVVSLANLQHAKAQFQDLIRTGSPEDRMWSYYGLADTQRQLGEFQSSDDTYRAAAVHYPHFAYYYVGLGSTEHLAEGRDERALADLRTGREMQKNYGRSYTRTENWAALGLQLEATEASVLGDYAKAADDAGQGYDHHAGAGSRLNALVDMALDHAALAATLARAPVPTDGRQERTAAADEGLGRLTHAFAMGDWAGVVDAYGALDTSQLTPGARQARTFMASPLVAIAEARLGHSAQAQALISTMPLDCYRCVDARGVIASASGDWAGADRWFAEAERLAPSPPLAYADQAQSRLARGDVTGAIALLQTAYAKSPHYPDGLELWGEALARRGDYAGAAVKYAEADRYAPQWGRNHLMWAEALAKTGKTADARAQKQVAAGLDLTAADRAELNGLGV